MGIIVIGFALFFIFAVVVGIAVAGGGGRRDYDSGPAFWNSNPPDNSPHNQHTFGSSTSDSDAHRLHQQSDHTPSHESQHSWGGDSGSSSSSGGSDGGGSSGGDGGSSSS